LAAKLTGWRIDIKSETEAATEGLNEIKRQQLQMIRARTLESKVPTTAGDDLLSRAEWLLREKDRSAVTLDHAAQLLADAEAEEAATEEAAEVTSEEPAAAAEAAVAPVAEAEPGAGLEAQVEVEAAAESAGAQAEVIEPSFDEIIFEELDLADLDETEDVEGAGKAGKGKKTGKGQRELVYDDRLGQVVSRKKRKPGRQGWEDDIESY
jgi:hypothetical protein